MKIRFYFTLLILIAVSPFLSACNFQQKPQSIGEFWSIKIDQEKSSVEAVKGKPRENQKGKTLIYFADKTENVAYGYAVGLHKNKVRFVMYFGEPSPTEVTLSSVRLGDSKREVQAKVGQPSFISVMKGIPEETHTYKSSGMLIKYMNDSVISFGITNSTFGPVRYIEEDSSSDNWK